MLASIRLPHPRRVRAQHGRVSDEANRQVLILRYARILRRIKSLDDDSQREVEQFIAFKKAQRTRPKA